MAARPPPRKTRSRKIAAKRPTAARGASAARGTAAAALADRAACPIVALGASAGGLEAFEKFFSRMPGDSGMAFVLVPHLDAHHKSAMTELVRRYTDMEVITITDGMKIEANRVHVIPSNANLSIERGSLRI